MRRAGFTLVRGAANAFRDRRESERHGGLVPRSEWYSLFVTLPGVASEDIRDFPHIFSMTAP
jgi:hypothetical protein